MAVEVDVVSEIYEVYRDTAAPVLGSLSNYFKNI
jgi:hypothetical protein